MYEQVEKQKENRVFRPNTSITQNIGYFKKDIVVVGKIKTTQNEKSKFQPSLVSQLRRAALAFPPYVQTNEVKPVYFRADSYAFDRVYQRDLGNFNTAPDFVRAAAAEAGIVGSMPEIFQSAQNTKNHRPAIAGQEKWVTSSEDMGRNIPHKVEPFNIKLRGTYGAGLTPISMIYHFGNFNNGYIMYQSDNGIDAKIRGYQTDDNNIVYSNRHDTRDEINDEDIDTRMVGNMAEAERWDARTIVGGEGARFSSVRDLSANGTLTNDSRFFTSQDPTAPANGDDLVATITLANLWGIWSRRFSGRFNITDAQLQAVVRQYANESSDQIEYREYRDMVAGSDYDLDRNQVKQ